MSYISRSASDHELYEFMEEEWDRLNEGDSFDDIQSKLLYKKITADPRFALSTVLPEERVFGLKKWLSVAAGLLVFLSIGFYIAYHINTTPQQQAVVYQERVVPNGKKIQISLPDGTQVWVNSGSKLRFPSNFTGNKRELYLEGEAYFDVAHDAKKPFIIHTGKVFTQVLGTAFNVKAYGSNEMSVTVARGKVSVGLSNKLLSVLTPNLCLNYNQMNGNAKTYKVDASKLRWMNGDLIFDNMKLDEAARVIERWYDVQINFAGAEAKTHRFTASFLKHENIDQVMNVLSELSGFKYDREGKKITIQ
jgi:ferric-dicitrate binding protein FerR (iron transport regulator)